MEQKFTLRQARVLKGYTQGDMAKLLNIHKNTYATWEKHPEDISYRDAVTISEILGQPLDSLIFLPSTLQNVEN